MQFNATTCPTQKNIDEKDILSLECVHHLMPNRAFYPRMTGMALFW